MQNTWKKIISNFNNRIPHSVRLVDSFEERELHQFDEVVVLADVIVVHPPNLSLIKEGFGRISQPNLWLIKEGFGRADQPVNLSGANQLKMNL